VRSGTNWVLVGCWRVLHHDLWAGSTTFHLSHQPTILHFCILSFSSIPLHEKCHLPTKTKKLTRANSLRSKEGEQKEPPASRWFCYPRPTWRELLTEQRVSLHTARWRGRSDPHGWIPPTQQEGWLHTRHLCTRSFVSWTVYQTVVWCISLTIFVEICDIPVQNKLRNTARVPPVATRSRAQTPSLRGRKYTLGRDKRWIPSFNRISKPTQDTRSRSREERKSSRSSRRPRPPAPVPQTEQKSAPTTNAPPTSTNASNVASVVLLKYPFVHSFPSGFRWSHAMVTALEWCDCCFRLLLTAPLGNVLRAPWSTPTRREFVPFVKRLLTHREKRLNFGFQIQPWRLCAV